MTRWLGGLPIVIALGLPMAPAVAALQTAASFDPRDYPVGMTSRDIRPAELEPPAGPRGERLYGAFCAACHGREGRGDGIAAAFCLVAPTDFTRAQFKVRSTPSGTLPRDTDLARTIRRGAGGDGAMPSFAFLSEEDVRQLILRIKRFSPRWKAAEVPAPVALPAPIKGDPQRGSQVYRAWGCRACHGESGRGDGPQSRTLLNSRGQPEAPTDFRRPWTFKGGSDRVSIARSTVTGFNGTTMPGYDISGGGEQQIWDLVAYLRSLQKKRPNAGTVKTDTSTSDAYWKIPIQPQSGDLSAASCAACHLLQFTDWIRSRHAAAMDPGVWAQLNDRPELTSNCASCHAPLAEQPADSYLAADGVTCSVCHSRAHQKYGPPATPRTLLALVARYPAPHGRATAKSFFEKTEFCAGCHQFRTGEAQLVHGAFLENTVEEWRGSPASREGKTCQGCHMPDRRHFFRGIHDPDTVRSGVQWAFDVRTAGERAVGRMTLTNTGTGHYLPTYVVPEIWMRIELKDAKGEIQASSEKLIARKVQFSLGSWSELSDTRLAPGETATLDYDGPLPSAAVVAVGRVIVLPDAWHVESLEAHLRETRSPQSARSYQQAVADMKQAGYTLFRSERGPR